MIKRRPSFFLATAISLFASLMLNGCATQHAKPVNPIDPYEPFNRVMYSFNDLVDKTVLKPTATLYVKIVPKPVTKGIGNFFSNVDTVPTIANDLLQANFYQATSDSWRLIINTTIGIGGFFDVATNMGLEHNTEDLGLTFARWGYKHSNYLVLPFLGPLTVRDALAWPINYEFLTVYPYVNPVRTRYIIYGISLVSKRADLLHYQDVFQQAAIDKYAFMRNAYLQRRAYLIERNNQLSDPYIEKNNFNLR
jgi:phospholipid-binding lipoprotein MlaA